jgi:hypothetical protein
LLFNVKLAFRVANRGFDFLSKGRLFGLHSSSGIDFKGALALGGSFGDGDFLKVAGGALLSNAS